MISTQSMLLAAICHSSCHSWRMISWCKAREADSTSASCRTVYFSWTDRCYRSQSLGKGDFQ